MPACVACRGSGWNATEGHACYVCHGTGARFTYAPPEWDDILNAEANRIASAISKRLAF